DIRRVIDAFDAQSLVYPWTNEDARLDVLSENVQAIAADADRRKQTRSATFAQIWQAAHAAAGLIAPPLPAQSALPVPFLSEPWYCCAEPTKEQLVSIGVVANKSAIPSAEAIPAPDGFV